MCKTNKKHFRLALASAGISATAFAKQIGVHKSTLCLVLNGKAKSRRVSSAIDNLIAVEFKKLKIKTRAAA